MYKEQIYGLDRPLYNQIIGIIQEYPKVKLEYEALLVESPAPPDGMPRSGKISDPVASIATRRERKRIKVESVEWGLAQLPEMYRQGVMDNIIKHKTFPDYVHKNTWKYYKRKFVYKVAEAMGDI